MAFINARLPEEVERGVAGGPEFKTSVIDFASGREQRNQDWEYHRGRWNISYGITYLEDEGLIESAVRLVSELFYRARGRAHSFLFKDWSDYELEDELIATGDGVIDSFQITKTYGDDSSKYVRKITRPISDTVTVKVNDVDQPSGWVIDPGGLLSFAVPPPNGHTVKVSGEFDIPVRFDSDHLQISLEIFNAGSAPDIPIIEIRE